jgi:hypothetical protein
MKNRLHIRPAKGKKIRIPYCQRFLSEAGERVPRNQHWLKKLKEGDVELVPEENLDSYEEIE